MPLLKRKRVDPVAPPPYDPSSKESRESTVWYCPLSKEIFTDYSEYLKRTQLYKKRIWQCESTGKSNLTYYEALESEKIEKEKVQDKLPEQLQRSVLLHIQFQTARLDAVVDNAYQQFVSRYVEGEVLYYVGDDKKTYTVKVLEANVKPEDESSPNTEYYKIQFMLKNTDIVDKKKGDKIVPGERLKRERFAFSKNFLKKFVKEYTTKDTYIGAPWIVSDLAAERFNIETKLPRHLQEAKDAAYAKSRKKRSEAVAIAAAAIAEAEGGDINDKPLMIDARKIESTLKYPMEDLNVPAYRRSPSGSGLITDMTPGTSGANKEVQNPTGDLPPRPQPSQQSTIPRECFGSFLMVWSFLSVFSQPLKLSPFTVDDFENALRYHSHCTIMTEANVALLNAIIKQRDRLKKESLGHGSMAREAAMSLYGTGYQASGVTLPLPAHHMLQQDSQYNSEDEDVENVWKARPLAKKRVSTVERGCGSLEVENVGFNWDHGTVDTEEERVGWEDILIGFINQLAPIEWIDDIDRILNRLVPTNSSTLEDREEAYISLSLQDKIKIFELLISVANESYVIKSYMFECQDQMTELRKEKIDMSRDRKRITAERQELDDKVNESNANTPELHESDSSDGEDSNGSEDEDKDLLKAQRQVAHNSRHESRQEILKRRQLEREEREAKRLKLHHLQREEARIKNKENKKRNELRKRLDTEEQSLHKREEQIERDMRKFNNHRIKPLGRDKFYNRYYYLDDIGGTLLHGSGRLYVQSPSDTDIMILMERDSIESIDRSVSLPCGRGGGVRFVTQLLEAQGLNTEAEFFSKRVEKLKQGDTSPEEWWQSYDDPEDLQALIDWLNPKGIREFRLKRELEKQYQNIVNGMKKRVNDQNSLNKLEATRRNTRSKVIANFPPGSWLAYTNKLADI